MTPDRAQDRSETITDAETARRRQRALTTAELGRAVAPLTYEKLPDEAGSMMLDEFRATFCRVLDGRLSIQSPVDLDPLREASRSRGVAGDPLVSAITASQAFATRFAPVTALPPGYYPLDGLSGFRTLDNLCLQGSLAAALHQGGAYSAGRTSADRATALTRQWVDERFAGHLDDVLVATYDGPDWWCEWFYGMGWDHAWFVLDLGRSTVDVLLATDTD